MGILIGFFFGIADSLILIALANCVNYLHEANLNLSHTLKDPISIIFILGIILIKLSTKFGSNYFTLYSSKIIGLNLKDNFYNKILTTSLVELNKYDAGFLTQKILVELHSVQKFIVLKSLHFIKDSIIVFIVLVNIFLIAPHVVFVISFCLIGIYFLNKKIWHKIQKCNNLINQLNIRLASFIHEIKNAKVDQIQYNYQDLTNQVDCVLKRLKKLAKFDSFYKSKNSTIIDLCVFVIVLILGIYFLYQGTDWNKILIVLGLCSIMYSPIKSINQYVSDFSKNKSSLTTLGKLQQSIARRNYFSGNDIYNSKELKIEFKGISFNYHKELIIFRNLNGCFKKGITFVKGDHGIGKSTFCLILAGLYSPREGTVNRYYRENRKIDIIYVNQQPLLINGSVLKNIMFDLPIKKSELLIELEKFSFQEIFTNKLLDKKVVAGGINLSGGEKQLISITRALIRNPQILIIDELSNNLSPIIISKLISFVKSYRNDLITIIVSHKNLINSSMCEFKIDRV